MCIDVPLHIDVNVFLTYQHTQKYNWWRWGKVGGGVYNATDGAPVPPAGSGSGTVPSRDALP